jgi:protein-S-isoprenylcysteine O-methyltransferase Ste14
MPHRGHTDASQDEVAALKRPGRTLAYLLLVLAGVLMVVMAVVPGSIPGWTLAALVGVAILLLLTSVLVAPRRG